MFTIEENQVSEMGNVVRFMTLESSEREKEKKRYGSDGNRRICEEYQKYIGLIRQKILDRLSSRDLRLRSIIRIPTPDRDRGPAALEEERSSRVSRSATKRISGRCRGCSSGLPSGKCQLIRSIRYDWIRYA
ncbi:uncharacterized protein LOC105426583 [Pogonomyrmex barbatus]|uniref:Uncharacterized protein LOC105426583 n=1 Tax=Pogonomyrmex barbatus TaxID=144034 RepID=A0A6I9WW78_9HYME|nr:uncharacterized protein LOC105426583 [Pogonomyrmex barbatus]